MHGELACRGDGDDDGEDGEDAGDKQVQQVIEITRHLGRAFTRDLLNIKNTHCVKKGPKHDMLVGKSPPFARLQG